MLKFTVANYPELLGYTKVCQVSDEDIWQHLVSPMTKGLLGDIVEIRPPRVIESLEGLFPGDHAANLNDHRMFGGQRGFVRFPYVTNFCKPRMVRSSSSAMASSSRCFAGLVTLRKARAR
jgi:hypothetical protein